MTQKSKCWIIAGILFLMYIGLIQITVPFNVQFNEPESWEWRSHSIINLLDREINQVINLSDNNILTEIPTSGNGLSWETAYNIENIEFTVQNSTNCVIAKNSTRYIRFFNCTFDYAGKMNETESNTYVTIKFQNVSHIEFSHCYFGGQYPEQDLGLLLDGCSDIRIKECIFNYYIDIVINGSYCSNLIIQGNRFSDWKSPYDYLCIFVDSQNCRLEQNWFRGSYSLQNNYQFSDAHGFGLKLWRCWNWTIKENLFEYLDNAIFISDSSMINTVANQIRFMDYGGIDFSSSDYLNITSNTIRTGRVILNNIQNALIAKNNFYKCDFGLMIGDPVNMTIKQNIFRYMEYQAIDLDLSIHWRTRSDIVVSQNLYYESGSLNTINLKSKLIIENWNFYIPGLHSLIAGLVFIFLIYLILAFRMQELKILYIEGEILKKGKTSSENPIQNIYSKEVQSLREIASNRFYTRLILLFIGAFLLFLSGLSQFPQGYNFILLLERLNGDYLVNIQYLGIKSQQWIHFLLLLIVGGLGWRESKYVENTILTTLSIPKIVSKQFLIRFIPLSLCIYSFHIFGLMYFISQKWNPFLIIFGILSVFICTGSYILYRYFKFVKQTGGKVSNVKNT